MKQFKGGLYANLGNYKSSLPQTKILNDLNKQSFLILNRVINFLC